jgi:hypothetical protein
VLNGGNEQCTGRMAEFAGMSAACRGDVSHPVESGQDRLKPLEPNFEFDPNHRIRGAMFRLVIGIFCRAALLASSATGRLICSPQAVRNRWTVFYAVNRGGTWERNNLKFLA